VHKPKDNLVFEAQTNGFSKVN